MSVYAEITNGTVTNTVISDPTHAATQGWVLIDGITPQPSIGWGYDGKTFTAPPPPTPTPQEAALATVAQLAASLPGHIAQATTDAAAIKTLTAGASLDAAHVTALQNHADGWVTLLGGLQALLQAQGLA